MDNVFITQLFDWNQPGPRKARWLGRLLRWLGYNARIAVAGQTGEMSTVEQRINMYHLLSHVLTFGVPGAVVEFGSREGTSAVLFQKVINALAPGRELHVFDAFLECRPKDLEASFQKYGLRAPVIHAGLFGATLPHQVPEQVCFAHVDIGPCGTAEQMTENLQRILDAVYARLMPGAVCLMMDYCEPDAYERQGFAWPNCALRTRQWDQYPHVHHVCDEFLRAKEEKMVFLYSGEYSHGFFRKRQ
jgi:O-methyltransferase